MSFDLVYGLTRPVYFYRYIIYNIYILLCIRRYNFRSRPVHDHSTHALYSSSSSLSDNPSYRIHRRTIYRRQCVYLDGGFDRRLIIYLLFFTRVRRPTRQVIDTATSVAPERTPR